MDLDAAYDAALKRFEGAGFDQLRESDRVLVTIWGLEADVNNGGFDQYFFNSSGDQAFFAERALRLIGAERMAEIVRRAVSLFDPDGVPRDRFARQRALDRVRSDRGESMDALDTEFFAYPDDISALVLAYLARVS